MAKARIDYIDAIRGVTMILVVYSHILLAAETPFHLSKINGVLMTVRLPLFFFISGYFVYSARYTAALFARRAQNRLTRQLYPTLLFWTAFCLLFTDRDFSVLPYDTWKQGYWFTVASAEMFFFIAPLLVLLSLGEASRTTRNIVLITAGVLLEYILLTKIDAGNKWVGLWSLRAVRGYLPFFMAGILFKLNEQSVTPVLVNRYTAGGALLLYLLHYNGVITLPRFCPGWAGIVFIHYGVCRLFRIGAVSRSKAAKGLRHIGTMTLEIYLLHYFGVYALAPVWKSSWFAGRVNTWAELPVVLSASLIITGLCLSIVWLLKQVRLYVWLFPPARQVHRPVGTERVAA